jgi:hypothetical protein
VDPDLRTALLITGLLFCAAFTAMTLSVASDSGVDIFTLVSLVIVGMIVAGLVGAIRNPPPDE